MKYFIYNKCIDWRENEDYYSGLWKCRITLAEQLSTEGHNITVIDTREQVVESVYNSYDILGVVGNGTSFNIQMEAGVEDADLLVAVTGSDELNLLCCLIAKKLVAVIQLPE